MTRIQVLYLSVLMCVQKKRYSFPWKDCTLFLYTVDCLSKLINAVSLRLHCCHYKLHYFALLGQVYSKPLLQPSLNPW